MFCETWPGLTGGLLEQQKGKKASPREKVLHPNNLLEDVLATNHRSGMIFMSESPQSFVEY